MRSNDRCANAGQTPRSSGICRPRRTSEGYKLTLEGRGRDVEVVDYAERFVGCQWASPDRSPTGRASEKRVKLLKSRYHLHCSPFGIPQSAPIRPRHQPFRFLIMIPR